MGDPISESEFLEKVEQGRKDLYPSDVFPKGLVGGLCFWILSYIVMAVGTVAFGFPLLLTLLSAGLHILGLAVAVRGASSLERKMRDTEFLGATPSVWGRTLLYLETRLQGLEISGHIYDRSLPTHLRSLDSFMHFSLQQVVSALESEDSHGIYSTSDPYAREFEKKQPSCLCCIFGMAFLFNLMMFIVGFVGEGFLLDGQLFTLFLLASTIITGILLFWYARTFIASTRIQGILSAKPIPVEEIEAKYDFKELWDRIIDVYSSGDGYPLLLLVIGDYPELTYTSRVFTSTTGNQFQAGNIVHE